MAELALVLFCVVCVVLYVVAWKVRTKKEKENFNNGICKKCGAPLEHYGLTTSQGARGYECPKCGYIAWLSSASSVDKDFRGHIV